MAMSGESNSCVETPAAPEWLSKLEDRREKLKHTKLGHEAGAGAPCGVCEDKCPGLDLHFWRKVCRNCKCRKDQHLCHDDDLSGWAQFEILGQIRSKPAFIKIKALASQPVHLEWIPPNAGPDVVSDYMEKLGAANIPVAGSDAANKRKQQLEFQVPPHDLDAGLCDNLTDAETLQLQEYVQKIRENCVGQGSVVRIGRPVHGVCGYISPFNNSAPVKSEIMKVLPFPTEEAVATDQVLADLLQSDKLLRALTDDSGLQYPRSLTVFGKPFSKETNEWDEALPSPATQLKMRGLSQQSVISLVHNGPIYDKLLGALKDKKIDISRDPKLGPIAGFRREYLSDPKFKREIDDLIIGDRSQYSTPLKQKSSLPFNSPLPLKTPLQLRIGSQMHQETPVRKARFGSASPDLIDEFGLPAYVEYQKDPLFAHIINSESMKQAVAAAKNGRPIKPVSIVPLSPIAADFANSPILGALAKRKLNALNVDSKMIQSALLNGPFYDQLFQVLHEKGIDCQNCQLLAPIRGLREELLTNDALCTKVGEFVASMPDNLDVSYGQQRDNRRDALITSRSNDSGFESKASTPNYPDVSEGVNANEGRFSAIPGIDSMNMYPTVKGSPGPGVAANVMPDLQGLQLIDKPKDIPAVKCCDCHQTIVLGEVAVRAERAGRDIVWHPECFKCFHCRELLADLVYFFHGGHVYCGRDLAVKLKIPRCKACDELIFTKEYTAAEGSTFHIKHFCCYHCDTPLAGHQYIPDEKTNMPLCLSCYDEYFAATCQSCGHAIGPADEGVAWGEVHWHGKCFNCGGIDCGKSLLGGRFCVQQNMPFCSTACVRSVNC